MKKKGFTLIELLAVIVILAIIALIATPIVMNLIENSRKGAAERSAENLEHSAEIYYYNKKLDGGFPGITFTCKNGSCSSNDETLEISGKAPEAGSVIINKDGTITLSSIVINGYTCYKEGDSYTCDKITKTTEKTENGILTIDSKTTTLSNYIIKGNSHQETRSGKNLFNIDNITSVSAITNNNDGTITVGSYGATTGKTLQQLCPAMQVGDTITFSMTTPGVKQIYLNDGTYWGNGGTKTITQAMLDAKVHFYTDANDKTTPVIISNIQFEKGTSVTEYEPYGAMPSLDFPSEIQSVGDLVTDSSDPNYGLYEIPIKVIGKNLFNEKKLKDLGFELQEDGRYYDNSTNSYIIWENIENIQGSLNIQAKIEYLESKGFEIQTFYTDGTWKWGTGITDASKTVDKVQLSNSAKRETWISNILITTDLTSNDYESYKENKHSIYLDEPLRCLGDVCDYLDYEKGQIVRNTQVKKFNGEENWYISDKNFALANWDNKLSVLHLSSEKQGYKCNIAKENANSYYFKTHNWQNVDWILFPFTEKMTTLEAWKSYLKSNNVYVLYSLATQTEETISLPEININRGISHIIIDTNIKPKEFSGDYYK